MSCFKIFFSKTILPDGTVSICKGKLVRLDNLNETTLDEILETQIIKGNLYCNRCWLNSQRPFDILVARTLKHFFFNLTKKNLQLF